MTAAHWSGPARVLVTGGGTGIGLAIVTSLLEHGVKVVAIGRRREALEEAKSLGADVLSWDVTHNPRKLFETIGRVDGLVHNAGLCIRAEITEWSSDDWESMWRVNLLAPALLSQAFAEQVDGPGAIVAVASTLAQRPSIGTAGYGSTKAGLVNLIKHLALELAPHRIRANVVLPGIVPTDMTTDRVSDALLALHPIGRLGTAQEVSQAVLMALSSEWMTGSQLVIDGGLLVRE